MRVKKLFCPFARVWSENGSFNRRNLFGEDCESTEAFPDEASCLYKNCACYDARHKKCGLAYPLLV
jgi:hypothetical protein